MLDHCINCENVDICKWCEEYTRVGVRLGEIEFNDSKSPVTVAIHCRSFKRREVQKPQGFIESVR